MSQQVISREKVVSPGALVLPESARSEGVFPVLPSREQDSPVGAQNDKRQSAQEQIAKDLKLFRDETATKDVRSDAKQRLLAKGFLTTEIIDGELTTARGPERNELLRFRKEIAVSEATKFGLELTEIDFTVTPERAARLQKILKGYDVNSILSAAGELTLEKPDQDKVRQVFQAISKGIATSREVKGEPRVDSQKVRRGVVDSYSAEMSDGRIIQLEMHSDRTYRDALGVPTGQDRFNSIDFVIKEKVGKGETREDKKLTGGTLFCNEDRSI